MVRVMPFVVHSIIIWRSDYISSLKYHFEQLLVGIFYLLYLLVVDYSNSRANQLALFFDNDYLHEGSNPLGYSAQHAEKKQARTVLLMYRPDGRGGIQGLIVDSFYINCDGKIANEFWIVTDCDLGTIKQVPYAELYKL